MNLEAELQTEFAGFLRRRRDLAKDADARAFAERYITGNSRLSPVEQLEIYREQFWLRHTASLVEDFPGVAGLLEQERWDRVIWAYLEQAARYTFTLRDLGEHLPRFIAEQAWLEQRALVAEMARYEWAQIEVFDAPDVPRLDPEKLGAVPPDAWDLARLVLDPALRLLRLTYPVVELRRRLIKAQTESAEPGPSWPEAAATLLAVHRRERVIASDTLEPAAFALLEAVQAGTALGAACEVAANASAMSVEALGAKLEHWFGEWAARGYVVDITLD